MHPYEQAAANLREFIESFRVTDYIRDRIEHFIFSLDVSRYVGAIGQQFFWVFSCWAMEEAIRYVTNRYMLAEPLG
jgi:hypothetical protein